MVKSGRISKSRHIFLINGPFLLKTKSNEVLSGLTSLHCIFNVHFLLASECLMPAEARFLETPNALHIVVKCQKVPKKISKMIQACNGPEEK